MYNGKAIIKQEKSAEVIMYIYKQVLRKGTDL